MKILVVAVVIFAFFIGLGVFGSDDSVDQSYGSTLSKDLLEGLEDNSLRKIKKAIKNGNSINEVDNVDGSNVLMIAAENCSSKIVKWLLKNGADVNHVDFKGRNVLMYAVMGGNEDNVRLILENKNSGYKTSTLQGVFSDLFGQKDISSYKINETDSENFPALYYAIKSEDVATCTLLIENGADVNALCGIDRNRSILSYALETNTNTTLVELLLKAGANANIKEQISPISRAITNNDINSVRILLRYNANPNISESAIAGYSPLQIAIEYGYFDIVSLLLNTNNLEINSSNFYGENALHTLCWSFMENGSVDNIDDYISIADKLIKLHIDINAQTSEGYTPLMFCCPSQYPDLAYFLIRNNANIDIRENDGWTSLSFALLSTNTSLIEYLLSAGADMYNEFTYDEVVYNAFSYAIALNNIEAINIMINYGFDINRADSLGTSVLERAIAEGKLSIVDLLIKGGASITYRNNNGRNAMLNCGYYAASPEIISSVLSAGAYINDVDYSGQSALSFAAASSENNSLQTAYALIQNGANVNSKSFSGITPLMNASQNGNLNMVQLLLENGAKVDEKDNNGRSAIFYAIDSNVVEVCNMLIMRGCEIGYTDMSGLNPLTYSILNAYDSITNCLLDGGADVFMEVNGNHKTWEYAIAEKKIAALRMLKEHGVDFTTDKSAGLPPIAVAIREDAYDLIPTLIALGSNINATCYDFGMPIISFALSHMKENPPKIGYNEAIKQLLDYNANINFADADGYTPLMYALRLSYPDSIIMLLVEYRADVSACSFAGESVLDIAQESYTADAPIITYLVENGAKENIIERSA